MNEPFLSWVWLSGAVGYLLFVLFQQWRLARRFVCSGPVDPALEQLTETARRSMGVRKRVSVLVTDHLTTPAVFGWWRPRVLLPRDRLADWTAAEVNWVIRHELAHVKRHDVLTNWLLIVVQAAHWFNPIIWWALGRLRAERELVCDASALAGTATEERQAYGGLLLRLTEQRVNLLSILSYKNQLKRRIAMIAQPHPPRYAWFVPLALIAGLACLTFTRAAEPPAPADNTPTTPATAGEGEGEALVLRELKDQLKRLDDLITQKQNQSDELQSQARTRRRAVSPGAAQEMELQRLEAQAQVRQSELLLGQLRKLPRAQLRNAAATVMPDASLQKLLEKLTEVEQDLAGMETTHHDSHPEVARTKHILATINRQIDARLDGMLTGLEAKRDLALRQIEELTELMDQQRQVELERSIEEQPTLRLQRDLANLQAFRDQLHRRILEEEIDAKLPPSARLRSADLRELRDQLQKRILAEGTIAGGSSGSGRANPLLVPSVAGGFNILGAVHKPGRYTLPGPTGSLVDALALAGGPTAAAKLSRVKVMRPGASDSREIFVLDAASMLTDSNAPSFRVRSGDTIYVEDRAF